MYIPNTEEKNMTMKPHPLYLHVPHSQFESYFLILSVMVLGQFCLGFVWLILRALR